MKLFKIGMVVVILTRFFVLYSKVWQSVWSQLSEGVGWVGVEWEEVLGTQCNI